MTDVQGYCRVQQNTKGTHRYWIVFSSSLPPPHTVYCSHPEVHCSSTSVYWLYSCVPGTALTGCTVVLVAGIQGVSDKLVLT